MIKNKEYQERLHGVIPGGAHTYSRGDDQYPENAPAILEKGKGAYVWDAEGNKFLDYGMGLRSVTVGYDHEEISNAAIEEIHKGINLTRATLTELKAAELMVELFPWAQMVKFGKSGSVVTTAAVSFRARIPGESMWPCAQSIRSLPMMIGSLAPHPWIKAFRRKIKISVTAFITTT